MGSQGSPVKSYDYLLKFLLVGDSDVGKGEILDSLQDGSAESPYAYSSGTLTHNFFVSLPGFLRKTKYFIYFTHTHTHTHTHTPSNMTC